MFETAACALAVCDGNGAIRQANPLLGEWTGHDASALVGTTFTRLLSPPSALLFEMQLRPRLVLGQRIDGALVTLRSTVREPVPVVLNAVQHDDGDFHLALVSVSEREAYEESLRRAHAEAEAARAELADTARALRESDALVRAQFAATPLPTFVWRRSAHGAFVLEDRNAIGADLLDDDASGIALHADRAFGADDAPLTALHTALTEQRVVECELAASARLIGGDRVLLLTLGPLPPDRVVMHVRDVTHEREAEARRRHGFKMQALGELVAGIAHEFNNVLAVISGNLELMAAEITETVPGSATLHDDLAAVQDASRRATALVAQLLAFGGRRAGTSGRVDVNELLTASERLLRPVIGRAIEWHLELGNDVPAVQADADQLTQVVTNLVINARDAVRERGGPGGAITLSSACVTCTEPGPDRRPGRYVSIAVRDTGTGMSEDVRQRAFEPFFTTKGAGNGTGLGLSTIYGIVRELGGCVEIDSTLGEGTCVRVLLPAVDS